MARKRTASAETLKPDPRYNSKLASKFINCLMWEGKKATAQRIFYGALDQIKKRMPEVEPIDVFTQAVEHIKPTVEVRSKRVGGATYQVPMQVNRTRQQSLALRWPHRSAFAATRDGRASVALPAGHAALLEAWFDVPESEDLLTLGWEPGGQSIRLLTTRTPVHAAIARSPRVEWPPLAAELPDGRAARGQRLFDEKCASCHGDPTIPGSSIAAPHLAGIGVAAATRVPGETAAQYLYQSMIDPDAYRARTCAGRDGCEEPPPMPPYGEVLSPQDASDLVAYLLLQGKKP